MIKLLKIIFRIPLFPFIFLFIIYFLVKITQNTNITEVEIKMDKGEELLTDEFKNHYSEQFKKYKVHINVINLILWFIIINNIK